MKKKILCLLLALVMVCGLLPAGALADEEPLPVEPAQDAQITITVSNRGVLASAADESLMVNRAVTVSDVNKDGKLTVHEALLAAHKAYLTEADYAASEGTYGLSVTKLWGEETMNTLFFVNGTGLSVGVDSDTVKEGDRLLASVNADDIYYSDWYTFFTDSAVSVRTGTEVTLHLKGHLGMAYTPEELADGNLGGLTVKTAGGTVLGVTDENGCVTVSFAEVGTYVVTASGTVTSMVDDYSTYPTPHLVETACPIIAPACVVTVGDNYLSDLILRTGTKTANILPAFDREQKAYACEVAQTVSTLYLTAALSEFAPEGSAISVSYRKADDSTASAVLTSGTQKAMALGGKMGNRITPVILTVGVEGNTQEYTINVTPKKTGYLSELTVASAEGGENLLTGFDSDDYNYSVSVAPGTQQLYFTTAPHPVNAPDATAAVGETVVQQTGVNAMSNNAGKFSAVTAETVDLAADGKTATCLTLSAPVTNKAVFVSVIAAKGTKSNSYVIRVNPAPAHATAEEAFEGTGTAEDPFLITSQAQLVELNLMVSGGMNFAGKTVKLAADVTLPADWTPMGSIRNCVMTVNTGLNAFSGTFDGDGHTVTVPKGGLPLFGYAENTTIQNLKIYGEEIAGYGLVNNFEGVNLTSVLTIDNVTLLSGTKTLKSGLVGGNITTNGWAANSPSSYAKISNCTVEEGVTVGYDGRESNIGSIAGRLQGTITNCVSNATVKGVNYVGGVVGTRDNATGEVAVSGCTFGGTVTGTKYVGGIAGGGYNAANDAPNGGKITLIGNTVTGTVTGTDCVGGIIGGDPYVVQLWENVSCSVKNNRFNGLISGETNVGAIIGSYLSLNCYDDISGNTFAADRGADKGIGSVSYVDTNAASIAVQFDETTENVTIGGVLYFSSETEKTGCPAGATKLAHNRTDDPLGADEETLWKASDDLAPVCIGLVMTGTPKTDYYIGEAIDLSGLTFTAKWNAGKADTAVTAADLTVTGFDSSSRKNETVTLSYGVASLKLNVRILEPASFGDTITVTFTLLGDTLHGEEGTAHTKRAGTLTTWLSRESYTLDENATVKNLLDAVEKRHSDVTFNGTPSQYGVYIESVICGEAALAELDNGPLSGWMYTVNGTHPDVGVDAKFLKNGDAVVFHYTDDYTKEEGSENWSGSSSDKTDTASTSDAEKSDLPFTDLTGHWGAQAAAFVYNRKLMKGVSEVSFAPDTTLTREMLVTILYRLAGEPAVSGTNPFTDVKDGEWYTKAILWAYQNKLVCGYGDGTFGLGDPITREQMAQILYAFAELKGYDTSKSSDLAAYNDADEISPWALNAMKWANAAGLITGRTGTEIAPTGTATRAETASVLMRFMQTILK